MRQRSRRPGRQYAAIPNAAMRDKRVSIEARGLLALLMTYSDEWEFFVDHLQDVACCGRDKMRAMLRDLEAAGYVVRERYRGEDGRLLGSQWVIVDDPFGAPSGAVPDGSPQDDVVSEGGDPESRPPENPSIGTDRLKNRPPEKPTVDKSAHIRKPTDKKTKGKKPPAPVSGSGGGVGGDPDHPDFDAFWRAYPLRVERDEALRAFAETVAMDEANASKLIAAARAYATSAEVQRGYVMKPANWLTRGSWRDHVKEDPKAVDLDALARQWSGAVIACRSYAASAIRPDVARRMLQLQLVTSDQLRAAGVTH